LRRRRHFRPIRRLGIVEFGFVEVAVPAGAYVLSPGGADRKRYILDRVPPGERPSVLPWLEHGAPGQRGEAGDSASRLAAIILVRLGGVQARGFDSFPVRLRRKRLGLNRVPPGRRKAGARSMARAAGRGSARRAGFSMSRPAAVILGEGKWRLPLVFARRALRLRLAGSHSAFCRRR
jgi:hypothetical protein